MRSIRPLEEALLPGVLKIENDSFRDPWSEDSYRRELINPLAEYAVLCEDDRVLGYAGFWLIVDEAHITNVAVAREARGQGLGKTLMEALLQKAIEKNARAATLEVRLSNRTARHLYESLGFLSAGIRPHYYPDGEDAVIMWKVLT